MTEDTYNYEEAEDDMIEGGGYSECYAKRICPTCEKVQDNKYCPEDGTHTKPLMNTDSIRFYDKMPLPELKIEDITVYVYLFRCQACGFMWWDKLFSPDRTYDSGNCPKCNLYRNKKHYWEIRVNT